MSVYNHVSIDFMARKLIGFPCLNWNQNNKGKFVEFYLNQISYNMVCLILPLHIKIKIYFPTRYILMKSDDIKNISNTV